MMVWQIHQGITEDPGATLPNGVKELPFSKLLFHCGLNKIVDQISYKAERWLSNKAYWKARSIESNPQAMHLLECVKGIIDKRKKTSTVIAVMAPWYEDETLAKGEGYIRRIKEIDTSVFGDHLCIYLYECPYYKVNRIVVDQLDENRIYIRYNTEFKEQREFVQHTIDSCDYCYSHSVLRVIPVTDPDDVGKWIDIFDTNATHVLDIHGAVVEEARFTGKDEKTIKYLKAAEKYYFRRVKYAVSLTEKMERYFNGQYDRNDIVFFRTPVISSDIFNRGNRIEKPVSERTVVYCGGSQGWQNVPLMIHFIRKHLTEANYVVYISNPENFIIQWGDSLPKNVIVKTAETSEIIETYQKAHYGLIFRDSNVLNEVACPTKIMEYIQFGLVPIVKTDRIGDFHELQLNVITVEDDYLSEKTRSKYATENQRIFHQLNKEGKQAIKSLATLLDER